MVLELSSKPEATVVNFIKVIEYTFWEATLKIFYTVYLVLTQKNNQPVFFFFFFSLLIMIFQHWSQYLDADLE